MMTLYRDTAADKTWREKADQNPSVMGALVVLVVIALPLVLL